MPSLHLNSLTFLLQTNNCTDRTTSETRPPSCLKHTTAWVAMESPVATLEWLGSSLYRHSCCQYHQENHWNMLSSRLPIWSTYINFMKFEYVWNKSELGEVGLITWWRVRYRTARSGPSQLCKNCSLFHSRQHVEDRYSNTYTKHLPLNSNHTYISKRACIYIYIYIWCRYLQVHVDLVSSES